MTKITSPTESAIEAAAKAINKGQLVSFGTETVYGLGGDGRNPEAVAKIFAAKGRPLFNPLISHIAGAEAAFALGSKTAIAEKLAAKFWPGAMTLVLDKTPNNPLCDLTTAGLNSVALRVPSQRQALIFLTAANCPIAAPSANRSGRISPTRAAHVWDELGGCKDLAFILDMGAATGGLESTVIDARGEKPIILRAGAVTADMIITATGVEIGHHQGGGIISPGQTTSHYAPSKPMLLNRCQASSDDIWIGFGDIGRNSILNLSPAGDIIEAAANFYDMLRRADAMEGAHIAIAPIPDEGIGIAINDRLRRAAAR